MRNLEQLDGILQRSLTRKQFLQLIGVMLLTFTGLPAILRGLEGMHQHATRRDTDRRTDSYGGGGPR